MLNIVLAQVRRFLLLAGGLTVLLMGLYPPWQVITPSLKVGNLSAPLPERVKLIGYHSIFTPPDPSDWSYAGDAINELLPDSDETKTPPPARGSALEKWELERERRTASDHLPKRMRMVRIDLSRLVVQWIAVTLTVLLFVAATFPHARAINENPILQDRN